MGRGSRGRGRGSVGDHPEDEEDFYDEEMEVRFSAVLGPGLSCVARAVGGSSVLKVQGHRGCDAEALQAPGLSFHFCCWNREKLLRALGRDWR